ncbi:unnamed protein product [Coregonus sp. 'balchen']|nr:unnamed protein product [Coregonus sp. 'balchen']
MGSAVERTDEHVREYLIYRGFTSTLKHLDSDIKADKEKGFRVDKIIDQLQLFINSFDLNGLKDYWGYLDRRLFCRLEDVYRPTVSKLRTSLFRYYVVYTVQAKLILDQQRCFVDTGLGVNGMGLTTVRALVDLVTSQHNPALTTTPSRNFFATFLPQTRRVPGKTPRGLPGSSPTQASLGCKDPAANQEPRPVNSAGGTSEQQAGPNSHPRQRRHQDHEKERKELFSKPQIQMPEKRGESGDPEPHPEGGTTSSDLTDTPPPSQTLVSGEGPRGTGGLGEGQPFIKLSQEEYGEHHSSIMHCRVDCSGRRVASLDVDGVIKVWSFNPIMQTKATIMSKSPLLSLEWATKPDRLLLLGSGAGTVRLYDTDAKKNLYEMAIDDTHPRILSLACSPSGTSFVCSAAAHAGPGRSGSVTETVPRCPNPLPVSGQLLLWDTKTVKQQLQFSLEPGPVAINCTAFNHNGNLLWNIHRCGEKQFEHSLPQDATGPFVLSGYSGYKQVQVPRGRLFAFDSEGQHVLTCSNNGGIIYRRVLPLGGHKAPVVTVDWCSAMDCGTCLTASMDGKIKLSTLLAQKS